MKNILTKFKINSLTYFVLLSFLITGFIKNAILIFIIIIFHELGHIFFSKIFAYKIESVTIYPFGGITKTEKLLNSSINKDIVIYFGGFIFQIILWFLFLILFKNNYINFETYKLFLYYNQTILIFNYLPIRPLDGGEIVSLLLEKKLSFFKSIYFSHYISLFFLILFFFINKNHNINTYMIITFLLTKIIIIYKKRFIMKNKFLLERHLYTIPYKKIAHNDVKDLDLLKKETFHFFKNENKYMSEKELLKQRFDN